MTVELIFLLVGLYFIGVSISITRTLPSSSESKTYDLFKLIFGIVLVILSYRVF